MSMAQHTPDCVAAGGVTQTQMLATDDGSDTIVLEDTMDEALEAFAVEGFVFDERIGHVIEDVTVGGQDGEGLVVGLGDDTKDFVVDAGGDSVAIVALFADFAAEEDHLFLFAERNRTELGAHAVAGDHRAGNAGYLGDVA